jgi:hypothetical protein
MAARKLLDGLTNELSLAKHLSHQANHHYQRATELLTKLSDKFNLLEKECLICYDTVRDAARTPCNHVYCATCIRDWLSRGRSVCPYCQQNVREADIMAADGEAMQSRTASNPRLPAPVAARNAFPRNGNTVDQIGNPFARYNPFAQFAPGAAQHEVQQGLFNPHQASGLTLNHDLAHPTPWPQNNMTIDRRQQPRRRRYPTQESQQQSFAGNQPQGPEAPINTADGQQLPKSWR